jgi:hypothetical protein
MRKVATSHRALVRHNFGDGGSGHFVYCAGFRPESYNFRPVFYFRFKICLLLFYEQQRNIKATAEHAVPKAVNHESKP